ncbi:DNA primase/helicase [Mycobacterium phage Ejimix]|nr:DNA primase/helicase [Mycobacterium phage DmpstrDiver]AWH13961.1 DNA primase/helicase [Mycobacterium phage Halley]AXQ52141.1 DNA primase/helicase [Mycobacterium phage Ejimix]QCO93833.1 DNA primase/helicase [Mycobacterium phage Schatzie]QDP43894.1 DNA primase/helicase [Mycobacterium phage Dallas]QQM15298.1 RecA-like DNA recombinase [Mycobacterium phage Pound]
MEGTRNSTLFQASANLSEFVNAGTLNENVARDALMDAARQIGLMDHEIEATIDSGFNKTVGKARAVPERKLSLVSAPPEAPKTAQNPEARVIEAGSPWGDYPPVDAANWMFDDDDAVVELWGKGDDILWAEGEALLIAGGQGLGKSTLAGQLVRAQLGLQAEVLGLPVAPVEKPILYLAMDRPRQLRRSMRRQFSEDERDLLSGRLMIRPGPPVMDMAIDPTLLVRMAEAAGAGVVYVDSLKDAAVGLSTDETGAMYNRARQAVLAAGVNLCELHHVKKPSADSAGGGVSDVYGSTWITSGAGSVITLSGEPGDLEVRFRHVKSPANEVGPWKIHLDPDSGAFSVRQINLLVSVRNAGVNGLSAEDAAMEIYECRRPTASEKKKAERRLNAMVAKGLLKRIEGRGGAVWFPVETRLEEPKPLGDLF